MCNLTTISDYLCFLLVVIAMLLLNALMIRGVNLILQGRTEIKPDGSELHIGKIGYPIRRYFDEKVLEKVYYEGSQLNNIIKLFGVKLPNFEYSEHNNNNLILTNEQKINMESNKDLIVSQVGCQIDFDEIKTSNNEYSIGWRVLFYKEYSRYTYPEWFRSIFYDCPPCMSTVWGTCFYWVMVLAIFKLELCPQLFIIWIGYWLALAYTNFYIEKR